MQKIKLSWSILNAWERGQKDDALNMYYGRKTEATPAMENGKRVHSIIAKQKPQFFPWLDESFIWEDIEPDRHKWQNYFKVEILEWLDLSLVVDCFSPEKGILIDWKTGKTSASKQNPMQLYLYSLALSPKWKLDTGYIVKVTDDVKLLDYMKVIIGDRRRAEALEYAETFGSEIYDEVMQ